MTDTKNNKSKNKIEQKREDLELNLKYIAEDLNLVFGEEKSYKIGKDISKISETRYFLINKKFNLISANKIPKKNKKYIKVINNNINYIKNELNITELPFIIHDKPITEFIYSKNFKNDATKIYLGYFQNNYKLDSLEFKKNIKQNATYFFKQINNKNIFEKYDLLKPYKSFFNYRNFNKYFVCIKDEQPEQPEQIGLLYNNIKIIDFIPFFTHICDKLKWDKTKLLKTLNKNKENFLDYIVFHKKYITIHYFIE